MVCLVDKVGTMKYSNLFTKTSKDVSSGEVSKNAQLLIKAGYVHKTMAGVYSLLPLGLRTINKIENIVRTRMNEIGGQEILMNSLHPKEWWVKTGRWDSVDILFKLDSQTGAEYALACSHEEQMTPIIKQFVSSWRDLPETDIENGVFPLSVYQIQTKFRDELRAKSGVMRGREFKMKDMYDFHATQESADKYYEAVKEAYLKAYGDMGLEVYPTEASGGIFTNNPSHEFQAVCPAGEDTTYIDPSTKVMYNEEIAPSKISSPNQPEDLRELEKHYLEGVIGVNEIVKKLGVDIKKSTKMVFYQNGSKLIAAIVRSDYNINLEKLSKISGAGNLEIAAEELVEKITGSKIGYAGLYNLPAEVDLYVDDSLENLHNFETGGNETGLHVTNCNFGRDVALPENFVDIKIVKKGDINPTTNQEYEIKTTAEVGNIFKFGTKYTKAFDITFTDQDNKLQYPISGAHGLGITRCMGVIAEIFSDDKGLVWPESVAPFKYHLITNINPKDDSDVNEQITDLANKIYSGSYDKIDTAENVFWDNRSKVGLGQKFGDAELMGLPWQIVVSKRSLENGGIELINRASGEKEIISIL